MHNGVAIFTSSLFLGKRKTQEKNLLIYSWIFLKAYHAKLRFQGHVQLKICLLSQRRAQRIKLSLRVYQKACAGVCFYYEVGNLCGVCLKLSENKLSV